MSWTCRTRHSVWFEQRAWNGLSFFISNSQVEVYVYKDFITNLYRQKEKHSPKTVTQSFSACLDCLTRSTEIPLGDISLLPFHSSDLFENLQVMEPIHLDLSMINETSLPCSPLLFTWSDSTFLNKGVTRTLFWGIADVHGESGTLYTGCALKTRIVTTISSSTDIADISLKNDGIYFSVPADLKADRVIHSDQINLFYYMVFYLLDALKVVCSEKVQYDETSGCYRFPIEPMKRSKTVRRSRPDSRLLSEYEQLLDVVGALPEDNHE